jgi:hypothetical protein
MVVSRASQETGVQKLLQWLHQVKEKLPLVPDAQTQLNIEEVHLNYQQILMLTALTL